MSRYIAFTTIVCDRCKAARLLTLECPECGKKPRENAVDPLVVQRRERVRQVEKASLDELSTDPAEVSLLGSWRAVLTGMKALEKASQTEWKEKHLPRFAGALSDLRGLETHLSAKAHLRPTLIPKAQLDAVRALLKAWEQLKKGLTTNDMGGAQALGGEAQTLTDKALVLMSGVEEAEVEAALLTDDDAEPSLVRRLVGSLPQRYKTENLTEATALAAREAQDVLGVPVPEDNAAQFVWLSTIARAHLDYDSFTATATRFLEAFTDADTTTLDETPALVEGLEAAGGKLIEAVTAFEATTANATTDAAFIRRLLRLYMELYEDVGGTLFAATRCILTPKNIGETCTEIEGYKFSTNLKWLSKRHRILTGEWHVRLRNAGGHGRSHWVSETGQFVVFVLKSLEHLSEEERTMSFDEVVDVTLELLETLFALQRALLTAAATHGYELTPDADSKAQSGFKEEDFAQVLIEDATKQYSADVTRKQGRWKVTGNIPADEILPLAWDIIKRFPNQILSLQIGVAAPSGNAEVSFSALDAALAKEHHETLAAQSEVRVKLLSDLTIQGKPALTEAELALWAALIATDENSDLKAKVRALREVIATANEHSLTESAETAKALIRNLTRNLPINPDQIRADAASAVGHLPLNFGSLHITV